MYDQTEHDGLFAFLPSMPTLSLLVVILKTLEGSPLNGLFRLLAFF